MATLRFTFTWDDDEGMEYDELIDQLMHLGVYDIDHEEAAPPAAQPKGEPKQKKGSG